MNTEDRKQLQEVVSRLFDDRASEPDITWLGEMLCKFPEVRTEYEGLIDIDSRLSHYYSPESAKPTVPVLERIKKRIARRKQIAFIGFTTAAVFVLASFYVFQQSRPVARVVDVSGQIIELPENENQLSVRLGEHLKTGQLFVVQNDSAKVELKSGGILSLNQGSVFEFVSGKVMNLHSGSVVAHCGRDAEKVIIKSPNVSFVDLGTEFGVTTNAKGESILHVFDGEVEARTQDGKSRIGAGLALSVDNGGHVSSAFMADTLAYDPLRRMLSRNLVKEDFDSSEQLPSGWDVHEISLQEPTKVQMGLDSPLSPGNARFLSIGIKGQEVVSESEIHPETIVTWDYGSIGEVNVNQPHTIEFNLRIDCPAENIRRLEIFGAPEPTHSDRDRSWYLRSSDFTAGADELSWQIYSSNIAPEERWLLMPIREKTIYRVIVEVDPWNNRYRTSVSNGKKTILTSLADGSPAKLNLDAGELGKLQWRLQAHSGEEAAFSIDTIRIRNRPNPSS